MTSDVAAFNASDNHPPISVSRSKGRTMNRIVIKLAKDGGIERICADRSVTVMIADESCPRMYQHTPLVGSAYVQQIVGAYSAGSGETVQSDGIKKPTAARSTRPHLTVVQ